MAAATEQMTVSINHISDRAHDTESQSLNSAALSEDGYGRVEIASREIRRISQSVTDACARIRDLETHASEISKIAAVIKGIASQTNLLALNAAIEAARAGEQGRGFAVVADEVRMLAERTSLATVEIDQMIAGIQTDTRLVAGAMDAALPQVEAGVEAADHAAHALLMIKDGSKATMISIQEVAEATREQSEASDSIAQKVEEIASMVDETTDAIRSIAETSAALEAVACELARMISRFRCN